MTGRFDEEIRAALEQVFDPCSLASNAPLNIIDMGLVRGWEVDGDNNLTVTMCVTSPSCTMGPNMASGAERLLRRIPGLSSATISFDVTTFWTPDLMSPEGKESLARRRRDTIALSGLKPQQWRQARPLEVSPAS
jgi:metal-sulfur cluster biosynthetic enzyme